MKYKRKEPEFDFEIIAGFAQMSKIAGMMMNSVEAGVATKEEMAKKFLAIGDGGDGEICEIRIKDAISVLERVGPENDFKKVENFNDLKELECVSYRGGYGGCQVLVYLGNSEFIDFEKEIWELKEGEEIYHLPDAFVD